MLPGGVFGVVGLIGVVPPVAGGVVVTPPPEEGIEPELPSVEVEDGLAGLLESV
jgi:hypothetical protein